MAEAVFYNDNQVPLGTALALVDDFEVARTTPLSVTINDPFRPEERYTAFFFAETITTSLPHNYHIGGRVACLGVKASDEQLRARNIPPMGLVVSEIAGPYSEMRAWGMLTLPSRIAKAAHYVRAYRRSEQPTLHARLPLAVLWPVRIISESEDA